MTWLLGGSTAAKIVLFLLVALGLGGVILVAKHRYDQNRREEGRREVEDQIRKETDDARKRSDDAADDYRRGGGGLDRLRDGTY